MLGVGVKSKASAVSVKMRDSVSATDVNITGATVGVGGDTGAKSPQARDIRIMKGRKKLTRLLISYPLSTI
jgi:hypothetical protein